CGIFFLTHPRNAGRKDLGCPFGCREAHRKQNSTKRSVAYYQNKEGKFKKRLLNARRTQKDTSSETLNGAEKSTWSAGDDTVLPDEVMVRHLQIIVTLIEEREVKVDAVLVLADELLRQHRMEKRKKVFYVQGNLRSNPP
ncbi:MAG: hypothetical protein JRF37_06310, partial [Deltaproteobacteria bacterium]|nr:hypothetical protein [Deltaproteobacteria bacterium]